MEEERPFTVEIPIRPREPRHRDSTLVTQAKIEEVIRSSFEHHFRLSQPQHQQPKCPEGLKIISGAFSKTFRDRSPTSSTMSSTHVPDSATTCSMPMSPTSSTFTRATTPDIDGPERLPTPFLASRTGTNGHRYRESCDSGSTFVDSINGERFPAYPEPIGMGHKEDPLPHMDISESEDDGQNDMHHTAGTPRPPTPDEAPEPPREAAIPIPQRPLNERMSFDSGSDRLSRAWEPVTPTPIDFSNDEADAVLDYVLQVTYGVELDEVNMPPSFLRQFVFRFIQDIGRFAFAGFPITTQLTHTASTSSSGSMPLARRSGSGRGSQNGKRKKGEAGRLDGDDDGDDLTDDEGDSSVPLKRARPTPREVEENLRLSCPFRKRNPHRFNVREHHSCAMTYFPKFAELRQHIVKQHKRNDPSSFMCDRCNRDFPNKKDLRDHQRLPKEQMCDVSDHDPESGIDGPTMTKLLSRKRASGMAPEVQWKEIWNLLFPDDDDYKVQPFDFCPVIEHFELQAQFMNSLKDVEDSLRNKGMTQQALETIGNIYRNQFIQVIEQCIANAQMMPYSNRSNRKNEPSPSRFVAPRHLTRNVPRPDSGVDVDEGSEDSQSVAVFPGGVFDGQGMLGHSDSVKTVRRVSSTSSEFRNSIPPRTLQPLMEQLPASAFGIGGSPSPQQKLSPSQQQHQQMPQQPPVFDQQADFMPVVNGITPEMAAQLWAYRDDNVETRPSPGQMGMYAPVMNTNGQTQFLDWNSGLQDHNGMYDFSGYMPR
ncbi:zinc finger domain-containing protein [Colletotrichum tofieldiae]|uniref:Zinc finger domain-containing protein n=1 Tax=Colletotrichum tofieldiae TaxID=708197 RepID=A0A166P3E6_9PEZI|nr:zinc finger domain-containing protein [Colletotrichum tofieldiae]GKT65369.1 zinc finger domain-containing protein [Colletotrichum tofieldiae]GKT71443.1 zinc finger domain-containing protein [Colletotrichum tofieldiae]GKT93623.1 zinc finger domain-containing protein [Colletotrichum tofieldiae]